MARVAGVDLPRDKRGEVALTYIFGIGRSSARRILTHAGVDMNRRVREWTEDETARVREVRREAERRHVELIALPTEKALEVLTQGTGHTNAILHLTC